MAKKRHIRTHAEKNRIRVVPVQGNRYGEWLDRHGDYDGLDPEAIWDGDTPWSAGELPLDDTRIEALYVVRGKLKGQQRKILDFLLEGVLDQSEIARRLGIKQPTVAEYLREIGKKIQNKSLYIR